jgi:FKBP-type peptidyl-prolyl cis-trans isomerase 2
MKAGESCDVSVEPAEAYGDLHSEAIQEIPKEALQGIDNLAI